MLPRERSMIRNESLTFCCLPTGFQQFFKNGLWRRPSDEIPQN
jgi:hypothetical protein